MMSGINSNDRITIRPARDDDFAAIIDLGVRCLGWQGDERDRSFFRWKHDENPFGRSPAWVAESGGRIAGFRTFLRWQFVHGQSTETLDVVRAVDTATDPDFQGRGIFRDLTMAAIEELEGQGVDAVFNTPNDKSRPGYLKMGWVELGRPAVRVRPLSLRGLRRMAAARTPAELWPDEGSDSSSPGGSLPRHLFPPRPTWRTHRTDEFRSWRYRFGPLGYGRTGTDAAGSVYRLRRRGRAIELSLCEVHGSAPGIGPGLRQQADYALALGGGGPLHGVPLPGQGPVITWRALRSIEVPSLRDLDLCLSDIELF